MKNADLYAEDLFDNIVDLHDKAFAIMGVDKDSSKGKNIDSANGILSFIKDNYKIDDTFSEMLDDLQVYIDVNQDDFILTPDIVSDFVKAGDYIKASSFAKKDDILILLLTSLDMLE